jgi:hypothetical protein
MGTTVDDLGLNPPQLTFLANNYNPGVVPAAGQLISNGFPATLPVGDAINISGPVKTTGPKRIIPRIMDGIFEDVSPVVRQFSF